jgi:hypothetical protein
MSMDKPIPALPTYYAHGLRHAQAMVKRTRYALWLWALFMVVGIVGALVACML